MFAGVVLALWAFVRPAMAMPAGLCDDRGACAIAPPPSLQTPDDSIRRSDPLPTSLSNIIAFDGKVGGCPHDGPTDLQLASVDPAVLVKPLVLPVPGCALWDPCTVGTASHGGARVRVERPPRA
jgi:hypothetical protein